MIKTFIKTITIGAALSGCAGGDALVRSDVQRVSGRIDLASLGRSSAALVAFGRTGRVATGAVSADGSFAIELRSGERYAIAFRDPSTERIFATVVFGERSGSLEVSGGEPVELGALRRIESNGVEVCEDPEEEGGEVATRQSALMACDEEDEAGGGEDDLPDGDGDRRPDPVDEDDDGDGVCDGAPAGGEDPAEPAGMDEGGAVPETDTATGAEDPREDEEGCERDGESGWDHGDGEDDGEDDWGGHGR
jgi:hypothetical protein